MFSITAEQTAILFVMMSFGALARGTRMFDDSSAKTLTSIVVNFTTPAIIVSAFQCAFDSSRLPALGWSFLFAAFWFAVGIAFQRLFFRAHDPVSRSLAWSVVFSNAGFMGIPLEYALFGADGVFYGSAAIVMFNLLGWTYGVSIFRPLADRKDMLRGLLNPANVSVALALGLFFLPWRLPRMLSEPLRLVGEMNTVLPMFIIGYYLAGAKFLPALKTPKTYFMLFLRHLAIPSVLIAVMAPLGFVPADIRLVAVIPAAAPIGVLLTVFAVRYGGDPEFSTACVSISTLLSILTLPVVVALSRIVLSG